MSSSEGPGPNAWLVTFGDLITLLLTFFVLMLSMSSLDERKLERAFSYFSGRPGVLLGESQTSVGPPDDWPANPAEQIQIGLEVAQVIQGLLMSKAKSTLPPGEETLDPKGEVRMRADSYGQVISFGGTFLFLPGSAMINESALPVLQSIADALAKRSSKFSVEGHADGRERPSDPRLRDRWELSAARAVNVLKYLIQKGKIAPTRVSAVGYGDSRPVDPGDSKLNRRVEIVIAGGSKDAKS